MEATSRCASSARVAVRHVRPDAVRAVQPGFDPLFPRNTLSAYWKSQYLDELSRRRDRVDHGQRRGPAGAADPGQHLRDGRRDRGRRPEETAFASARLRTWFDRRHVDRPRAKTTKTGSRGCVGVGGRKKTAPATVYLNFTGLGDDEAPSAGVDTAFGRNLKRLAEVKAEYDPTNFFRVNNNIEPAS